MKKPSRTWFLLLIPILILLAALIYQIPFVYDRMSWRVEDLKTRIIYAINPPDEAIFIPVGGTPAATPFIASSPDTPEPSPEGPIATDTVMAITPTALPERVILDGVVYVHQHERWNYCGPANLAMALNYWGWPGDRDDIARVVKPGINDPDLSFIQQGRLDKNVMPSEMIGFVAGHTDYNIVARFGGDLDLLKHMITTGYDETAGEFVVQDAYLEPGKDMRVDYQTYLEGWRSFDYLFMVIYPPERQDQVLALLGDWADPAWSYSHALEIAEEEIQTLTGVNAFYAWFNKGTSLVKMEHYLEAGEAFDHAFLVYE